MPYAGLAGLRDRRAALTSHTTVEALDDGDGLHWRTRMRYAIDEQGTVGCGLPVHTRSFRRRLPARSDRDQCCCSGNC